MPAAAPRAGLPSIAEAVATHARLQPDRIGARDSRRALSFAGWHERAARLSNGLLGLGLSKGDRVGVLAYNCIEWLEIWVALARVGLVAVPINFRLLAAEVAYIVADCGARALIVQHALLDRAQALRAAGPAASDAPSAGAHRDAPFFTVHFGGPLPDGFIAYEALIDGADDKAAAGAIAPSDTFALMYTSGTTGRPKGVIRRHEGNALIALATALEFGFSRDDTALLAMPLCHANSLYFGVTFIHLGACIVVDDRTSFDPQALLATLARERISFTSLVPTHYTMMLALPDAVKARYDVSGVQKLLISSAPARRDTKLAILEMFPNSRLYELYGSTEAGWVTLLRPEQQLDKIGSIGREWAGSGPVRLLDDEGNEVPDGETGELFSRTAYAFDGYWNLPDKTEEAFRGAWCSVGDMARRDADGFIHLVDRKSNMIISGGENIYPSEVEAVVAAHPAVQDVAVIGVADAKWGEAVQAVVVARDDRPVQAEELLEWCRTRLAGYKRPRSVVFIAETQMPRTATGKIQHRVLRQRLSTQ